MVANQIGGHAAIEILETYGVDTVFGIPGVHTLDLYRGIADRKMRHVGVRHEQGAGFMADGYARASGRPGVCCLITGPGLLNAATPIGQAYSDSVPMLVLCSVNASSDLGKGRGRLHEITDQRATVAPITAFARTIFQASELPDAVADAFAVFESARPRPVVLEMPLDMLASASNLGQPVRVRAAAMAPAKQDLDTARDLIDRARTPVVIAGGGTVDCAAALRAFVEKIGALCVTTTAGKGVFPDSHPASLRATLSLAATQEYVNRADLVIAIGTELAETDNWVDAYQFSGDLIRIDIDEHTLTRDYKPTVGILAEAASTLEALTEIVGAARAPDLTSVERIRAQNGNMLTPLEQKHVKVLDAMKAAVGQDGILATDMTQIAYTANFHFPCDRPRGYFHPCGFGTLGYALPAAIGAKVACPDRDVVALAGDAGFLFTLQELGTAVEEKLSLPIIVWNNDLLAQIHKDMVRLDIGEIGVKPRNPDYLALARSFGCNAVRPQSLDEITQAVKAAFKADGPTLIEIREHSEFLD
ncbi:5-guanidino-2-oxopentanoate decarboxylase [Shinella sumterensis]|uniref:5-guanidino-2-oxopentanoate decarboxylase n=1 Tax=Shinella sumterensis TaxID=1967501 RepID=A0AA50DCT5_9HYPH|nr:5-guanidino-2-oxopentanoate decarboxylase [Shinella sumterensis]WLS01051.1 5-guanidino-2-oxopentanoate decarboxylase [Shinella sumterensis]WLS11847.1 5-guanidino-2-oxopentanoate decarboxylase [Shinella sumterensis]